MKIEEDKLAAGMQSRFLDHFMREAEVNQESYRETNSSLNEKK